MTLFNFQGGTIKLMVKSLGIDLEEDKGDVIGLDVQDKVTMSSFIIMMMNDDIVTLSWTSSPITSPLSSSKSMPSDFTMSLIVPP